MKYKLLAIIAISAAEAAKAETLVTPNFRIEITVNCPEGNVTCNNVTYSATHKKSGNAISLKGKTLHRLCADGVTPCRFLGYTFKNSQTTYTVAEDGKLLVMKARKILVEEQGVWQ